MVTQRPKYTVKTRAVMRNARDPEQMLKALLVDETNFATTVILALGGAPKKILTKLEASLGQNIKVQGEVKFTDRAKQVLEFTLQEKQRHNSLNVGTEHVLMGLILGDGLAAQVLQANFLTIERVRHAVTLLTTRIPLIIMGSPDEQPQHLFRSVSLGVLEARRFPQGNRFDKFTGRARRVLELGQEEARRFNHNYIGTEHLLLGLVREGEGVAAKVLTNLGVESSKIRTAVEFIIGRGDRAVLGEIGLTPRAKKVIELAVDEARRLNHHYIGTEHILLGLVREDEGIAAVILKSLGVNLERVRADTTSILSASMPQPRPLAAPIAPTQQGPEDMQLLAARFGLDRWVNLLNGLPYLEQRRWMRVLNGLADAAEQTPPRPTRQRKARNASAEAPAEGAGPEVADGGAQ